MPVNDYQAMASSRLTTFPGAGLGFEALLLLLLYAVQLLLCFCSVLLLLYCSALLLLLYSVAPMLFSTTAAAADKDEERKKEMEREADEGNTCLDPHGS